jgi:hypothetical protein
MFIVAHPISAGIKGPGMEFFPDGDYLGCEKAICVDMPITRLRLQQSGQSNVWIGASFCAQILDDWVLCTLFANSDWVDLEKRWQVFSLTGE